MIPNGGPLVKPATAREYLSVPPCMSVASGATPTTVRTPAFSRTERPIWTPVNRGSGNVGGVFVPESGFVVKSETFDSVFAPCPSS